MTESTVKLGSQHDSGLPFRSIPVFGFDFVVLFTIDVLHAILRPLMNSAPKVTMPSRRTRLKVEERKAH